MNIRNFVPNDHIMSANEIMQTQSIAIQTYMLENEHLQKELKEVYDKLTNKEQQITQLTNNWLLLEEWLIKESERLHNISGDNFTTVGQSIYEEVLNKMKEIKEGKNE